ncbi:MAG TPA: hypothetical protein VJI12_02605 [archaeon]|nr:hypothetical protein [archaeon]
MAGDILAEILGRVAQGLMNPAVISIIAIIIIILYLRSQEQFLVGS